VIAGYTREAGVRNLEREIATICRGAAVAIAEGEKKRINVDEENVPDYLGPERFVPETAMRTSVPGVSTGMAWTPAGGTIIFVEAARMHGKERLILTGQLGDVMRESAQAALSYLKSQAKNLGITTKSFDGVDIHVHVPSGGIPKDGPSAGITIYSALASLFLGRTVRSDLAMTGEVTLRGLVLPVGGIKEKVLAAHRAGIKTVILPEQNRKDLEDIPETVQRELTFRFAKNLDQVVSWALKKDKTTAGKR
jgi:ATP-dependent Lon protease